MRWLSSSAPWAAAILFVAALALRAIVILERADDPFFSIPAMDSIDYHVQAARLARGEAGSAEPYFHPPLYVWFLGGLYRAFGVRVLAVQLVQALLGAASVVLTYGIARRAFEPRAVAWLAGALCALDGTLIYFDGLLLPGTLDVFLLLLQLSALLTALESRHLGWFAIAGTAFGLGAIHRGEALLFLPIALVAVWRATDATPLRWRAAVPRLLALVAPIVIIVAPVSLHNARYDEGARADSSWAAATKRLARGEFAAIGTNAGVNFLLGNDPATYALNDINHPEHFPHYDRLIKQPLEQGLTSASARSRALVRQTWSVIRADPAAWLALVGRKALELVNGAEIARNSNLYAHTGSSIVLSALLWHRGLAFPGGILLPLALYGLWVARPRAGAGFLLAGRLATLALFLLAFFVTARYRLPALPILAIYAAAALVHLGRLLRARPRPTAALVGSAALLAVLLALVHLPVVPVYREPAIHEYQYLARDREEARDVAGARELYEHVLARDPDAAFALIGLGTILRHEGDLDRAALMFERVLTLDPDSEAAHNDLALVHLARGNFAACEAHLMEALRLAPELAVVHSNLGALRYRQGDYVTALEHFRRAVAIDPQHADAHVNAGMVLEKLGERAAAADAFRAALAARPGHTVATQRLAALREASDDR